MSLESRNRVGLAPLLVSRGEAGAARWIAGDGENALRNREATHGDRVVLNEKPFLSLVSCGLRHCYWWRFIRSTDLHDNPECPVCLPPSLSFILDTGSFPCVLLYVYLCPCSVGAQIPAFRHPHPRVVAGVPYTRTGTGEQRG